MKPDNIYKKIKKQRDQSTINSKFHKRQKWGEAGNYREGSKFHLVGIIPISFNNEMKERLNEFLPNCLLSIGQNQYLAIHRAILECLYAGVDVIYLSINNDISPLIRKSIGEFAVDPYEREKKYRIENEFYYREVPIFYIPHNIDDLHVRKRESKTIFGFRDSLSWSILWAAHVAYHATKRVSENLIPDKYYVAFPYSVYSPDAVAEYRDFLREKEKNVFVQCQGKTVRDGEYLGFSFTAKEYELYKKFVKDKEKEVCYEKVKLKFVRAEKGSVYKSDVRFFSLDKVFNQFNGFGDNDAIIPIEKYFKINTWENYCNYLRSDMQNTIKKPIKNTFYRQKKWIKLASYY